jgi:hypothetical protein
MMSDPLHISVPLLIDAVMVETDGFRKINLLVQVLLHTGLDAEELLFRLHSPGQMRGKEIAAPEPLKRFIGE